MKKKINKAMLIFVVVIVLIAVTVFAYLTLKKDLSRVQSVLNNDNTEKETRVLENKILVYSDDVFKKIEIPSGKIEDADAWQRNDFEGFEGYPDLGGSIKQELVIKSLDGRQALARIVTLPSNENVSDYVCLLDEKKCKQTELTSGIFEGLDEDFKKVNSQIAWSRWDNEKDIVYGNVVSDEVGDVTPIYACKLQEKKCTKTNLGEGINAVVPKGSFSPSLEKFAVVKQEDLTNLETGKKWNLLLFKTDNLNDVVRTYDISVMIDNYEGVAYDSVQSVSWSQDEKFLAVGTSRRIFLLDLENDSSRLVYVSPTNEEGDYYWDSGSLYLTPDGKTIAFVDSDEFYEDETENGGSEYEPTNILKYIDLQNDNNVTSMYSGRGLRIEL